MKKIFQFVLTVFVGVSFLLLSGCPKKITPAKESSGVVQPEPSAKLPKQPAPKPPVDEVFGAGTSSPLEEEEMPRITKLEKPSEPPVGKGIKDQEEKTPPLKDLLFDLDQWALRPIDLSIVEKNAIWIIAHPKENVRIEGHGDSRGTNEYNLVLGEKRADAVKNALITMGIDRSRLTVISYGEERPFCMEENDACFQENRRAHLDVE